jgi:hypothetical protein
MLHYVARLRPAYSLDTLYLSIGVILLILCMTLEA